MVNVSGWQRFDLHGHGWEREKCPNVRKALKIAQKNLGVGGVFGLANSQWGRTYDEKPDYDKRYELFLEDCLRTFNSRNIEVNGPSAEKSNLFYIKSKGIYVLKTQEMEFPEGHFLFLGVSNGKNLKQRSFRESLKEARDLGYSVQVNHPYFMSKAGEYLENNLDVLEYVSAIEVFNGEAVFGNLRARAFYEFYTIDKAVGATSSSDSHSIFEIGNSYTLLPEIDFQKNSDVINKALEYTLRTHRDWKGDEQNISFRGFMRHACYFGGRLILSKVGVKLG